MSLCMLQNVVRWSLTGRKVTSDIFETCANTLILRLAMYNIPYGK